MSLISVLYLYSKKQTNYTQAMKRITTIVFLIVYPACVLLGQIDEKLKEDIRNSGYVHSPLPLDYSKSFESFGLTKKILVSDMLCNMEDMGKWSHKGNGGMSLTTARSIEGRHSLRLVAPTTYPQFLGWGLGFGTSLASFDVGGVNWE